MERKLVSLRNVDGISPVTFLNTDNELEEANAIEVAHFGGWNVIVKKNQFEIDQLAVFCEIDTILPVDIPTFAFLEGKRIRTKKLKGVVSQGVAFTIPEILSVMYDVNAEGYGVVMDDDYLLGADWTTFVGAIKYDEELAWRNRGGPNNVRLPAANARGAFPSFIHKTDEERIQNLAKELKYDWQGKEVVITEKLDGSSITIYANKRTGDSGICSRNLDLKLESIESHFIKTGSPYLSKLSHYCMKHDLALAIQGEIIGPGIQGNPYKLPEHRIYFFNVFDIDAGKKLIHNEAFKILCELEADIVPTVRFSELNCVMEDILLAADGTSILNNKTNREGIVIRALDGEFSFKAISNKWLLKEQN